MYTAPSRTRSYDPNHPPNLSISPSQAPDETALDEYAQERNIARYGIAGRVWDATFPIIPYLTLASQPEITFDPPCTIFTHPEPTILELGSGQSHASLHLLSELCKPDNAWNEEGGGSSWEGTACGGRNRGGGRLVLSDLENVVPLVRGNVDRWLDKTASRHSINDKSDKSKRVTDVEVIALPWGDMPAVDSLLCTTLQDPITHILMIDLIYFPHLYGPLIRTLLHLTNPPRREGSEETRHGLVKGETGSRMQEIIDGPEVILCYKARSLEFEETFFTAFERWFRMVPLLSPLSASSSTGTKHSFASSQIPSPASPTPASLALSSAIVAESRTGSDPSSTRPPQWGIHGQEQGVFSYICHRRADTLPSPGEGGSKGWWTPETDEEAMRGPVRHELSPASAATPASVSSNGGAETRGDCRMREREVDRSWGWAEAQLGAIEWE